MNRRAANILDPQAGQRAVLVLALGIDNFGSGLFLPLTLVYTTSVMGLATGTAGIVLAIGTAAGLVVPALTGRFVDSVGPRLVVIASQVVQAAGLAFYLVRGGALFALAGAVLVAAGTQMFYSALLALVADTAPNGPKDRSFALVWMVRAGAFGVGALVAGIVLSLSTELLRLAVAADVLTFLVAATLLGLSTSVSVSRSTAMEESPARRGGVLRDLNFVLLIVVTGLIGLAGDFFLAGFPLYADHSLDLPPWVTGTAYAVVTGLSTLGGTLAVRLTSRLARTMVMIAGVAFLLTWCVAMVSASAVPPGFRIVWVLAAVLLLGVGTLMCSRSGAIAEAAAPPEQRGAYLAAFQYAFTAAQLVAPLLVSLFVLGNWAPWAAVALSLLLAIGVIARLARTLPAHAVGPMAAQDSYCQRR